MFQPQTIDQMLPMFWLPLDLKAYFVTDLQADFFNQFLDKSDRFLLDIVAEVGRVARCVKLDRLSVYCHDLPARADDLKDDRLRRVRVQISFISDACFPGCHSFSS